ncbi:hypothetical protein PG989_010574 [Apiospora arundinis]|uniref:Apple domain-containing protein n=1 Tax=Apiospora arundinis TaxID=335852 RepID=A0ABR2HNW4_9PEZI
MDPDPRAVMSDESAHAIDHGKPHEYPYTADEIKSIPNLPSAPEPQHAGPPSHHISIPSGLEISPVQVMKPSAGTAFASAPSQPWAGMIPWDKEAEQKIAVKHHQGSDKAKRRRWIWYLVVLLLLAMVTALGLGLGLTLRKKRLGGSSGGSDAASAASDSTTSGPTASTTAPGSVYSDTAPLCPGANNTIYITPRGDGSAQYRRICGVSYDGNDIHPQQAETMGLCLSLCSGRTGCAGVVWYDAGPQGTDLNWCWLKNSMEKAVLSYRDEAQTAIRL